MGNQMFLKDERIRRRSEFERVLNQGLKKRVENICTLFFMPNGSQTSRLGIIASRKVGNAVERNRAKRKVREVFRKHKHHLKPGTDLVIISGRYLVSLPYSILEKKILSFLSPGNPST